MTLLQMRSYYQKRGFNQLMATARVCQDVILKKIVATSQEENISVKGGVLLCAYSGDARRATRDIDLDFVRYPLSEEGIRRFFNALNSVDEACENVIRFTKNVCFGKHGN